MTYFDATPLRDLEDGSSVPFPRKASGAGLQKRALLPRVKPLVSSSELGMLPFSSCLFLRSLLGGKDLLAAKPFLALQSSDFLESCAQVVAPSCLTILPFLLIVALVSILRFPNPITPKQTKKIKEMREIIESSVVFFVLYHFTW